MGALIKTIICLAASRKPGGRCIAGKDVLDSKLWVRPVSDGDKDAITNQQSLYADNSPAQVLDIIEIPVLTAKPKQYQTENILIDTQKKWKKTGVFDKNNLNSLVDNPDSLWGNPSFQKNPSWHNYKIPESHITGITKSLYLIQVDCSLCVDTAKEAVSCDFYYGNYHYLLPVTDPIVEKDYLKKSNGRYDIGNKYLSVSLGPLHEGFVWLFVAAIL